MESKEQERSQSPGVGRTLLDDLKRGDLQHSLRTDLRDLYHFYLDEDERKRLASMGQFRRWLSMTGWLLKRLILNLNPVRRMFLVLSVFGGLLGSFAFRFGETEFSFDVSFVSFLVLLIILMLELKDKLLARDELRIGRAVQLSLLPDGNPELPGWDLWMYTRPANEVGGDLIDYQPTGQGRLGLSLGDVAGKGLGAALLMTKLQATLRALAPEAESLEQLGERTNAIFLRDQVSGRYSTLIYLEIESGSPRVRLVNAGHLPPVYGKKEDVKELSPVAPPLGLLPDATYQEQVVDLQPGDWFLVYSDGLTEALNAQGEFFGEERVREYLRRLGLATAEMAGKTLLAEADRFIGEERPSDDLSIILLRRLEN